MRTPNHRDASKHTDACNAATRRLPLSGIASQDLPLVQAMRDCHALGDSHPASRLASALLLEVMGSEATPELCDYCQDRDVAYVVTDVDNQSCRVCKVHLARTMFYAGDGATVEEVNR